MRDRIKDFFRPFASNPRRWFWVGMLLLVLAVLALTGNLR
jgi:hypothetical protein